MKINLYLDGNLVEINKDIDFTLNKTYTELSDLTAIIVDYSKTISIPMTPTNNELFNMVFKLDHQVLVGTHYVNFDPTQRIPMSMDFNGDVVLEGYAILNKVNLKNRTYEINLYGQLGKIFSELKEKSLDSYSASNGMFKNDLKMNIASIAASFANDSHSLSWTSQDWTDFFGFAPQLYGSSDIIDTKGFEESDGTIKDFEEQINTRRGINYADVYVGDGLDFNQYGEMRTYMTRPYVYADKLVQLIKHEIDTGDYDGYTMDLDSDWFNSSNPYYADLCYFPGRETIIDKGKSVTGMVSWGTSERTMNFPMAFLPTKTDEELDGYTYTTDSSTKLITITSSDSANGMDANVSINCDNIMVRDRVTGVKSISDFNSVAWAYYNPSNRQTVPVRYLGIYDENDNLLYKLILCSDTIVNAFEGSSGFLSWESGYYTFNNIWSKMRSRDPKVVIPNGCTWVNSGVSENYCEVKQYYNFGNIVLSTNKFYFKMGCDMVAGSTGSVSTANISRSDYHTLCPYKNSKYRKELWTNSASWSSYFTTPQSVEVTSLTYRSGSTWTIREVLGEDFNPFTWMIDYAKRFRLFFDIDYKTKKITLKSNYFNTVTYKEAEVDYSKEVVIEPLIDTYKSVKYGYADNESRKGSKYRSRYSVNYGDMNIDTNIRLNSEVMSLIPDEKEGVFIPVSSSALNWNNLYQASTVQIKYGDILHTNKVVNTLDADGELKYYPFFCFRVGNYTHKVNGTATAFYRLTDDTPSQKLTGKYTYLGTTYQNTDYLAMMSSIPQFDNYLTKEVEVTSVIVPNGSISTLAFEEAVLEEEVSFPTIDSSLIEEDTEESLEVEDTFIHPVTGEVITLPTRPARPEPDDPDAGDDEGSTTATMTFLYWSTFGVPREVYNGNVPSNIESYSVYNRWKNYLNEIFNSNSKKVTCYVRMSYPDYINFKFNQLMVIDNCTFLVNKIMDFNPNSTAPTKVELIQIQEPKNLK